MSVTVTSTSLEETLKDYALHLSTSATEATPTTKAAQPPNWPVNYRRIPPYRPINKHLDLSERPNGSNKGELVFVTVMMNGVRLQSGLVRAWEQTGARWYPGLIRYKIGGEW